ncbi:MAG: thioesterase, partial [Chitinophagales bacterium]
AQVYKRKPPISMLVTKMEANYFKKADGRAYFSCSDGHLFQDTVEKALASGEGHILEVKSVGTNKKGEKIAEFIFTWSFKVKKSISK